MRRHTILFAIFVLLLMPAIAFAWKVDGPGSGGGAGTPAGNSGDYQVNNSGSFGAKNVAQVQSDLGMTPDDSTENHLLYKKKVGGVDHITDATVGTGLTDEDGTVSIDETVVTLPGSQTLTNKEHTAPKETVATGGTCSTSYNLDMAASSMYTVTLNGACGFTASNIAAGRSVSVKLTQSSTTAPTFSSDFKWPAGTAPTWSTSATKYDMFSCASFEGTSLLCTGVVDVR